jgi:hypothetical protein
MAIGFPEARADVVILRTRAAAVSNAAVADPPLVVMCCPGSLDNKCELFLWLDELPEWL